MFGSMNAKFIKRITPYIICALLALPLAFILTFILSPLWNWFETVSGIESLGHSGPANWCYVATYIALFSIFVIYDQVRKRRA